MKIGFIGAGAMAEALVKGLVDSGSFSPLDIICSDVSEKRVEHFKSVYGVDAVNDNAEVVKNSGIVVIAVKPHVVKNVVLEIKDFLSEKNLVITIAAGISTRAVETWADRNVPVVRVMPNTPCLLGQGISAISPGRFCSEPHVEEAERIFKCVGDTVILPENLMNAVTGLSGSGPAYVYLVIEALIDAAVTAGIPRDAAFVLVSKTVRGAADMVLGTGQHPAVLKAQVMSPGGTTAAGLNKLEAGGIRALFTEAVIAAMKRAEEIGE